MQKDSTDIICRDDKLILMILINNNMTRENAMNRENEESKYFDIETK